MADRIGLVERKTAETGITVRINLDGTGQSRIRTPLPFLSHMLEQIARHGSFDLEVDAEGDVEIDGHHTTEDLGIVIGKAVLQALGDRKGIQRYGAATLPMDEALVRVAMDLSGRPFFVWRLDLPKAKLGTFGSVLRGFRSVGPGEPARAQAGGVKPSPSDRDHLQGLRQGAAASDDARPAGERRTVDQGEPRLIATGLRRPVARPGELTCR
jgi:imidazoleglycerol phosphate dehydratase HisB